MRFIATAFLLVAFVLIMIDCSTSVDKYGSEPIDIGQPQTVGTYQISSRAPIGGYRDPSQYESDPVAFPISKDIDTSTSTSSDSNGPLVASQTAFNIAMNGNAVGEGSHSRRLSVNDMGGLNLSEISHAIYGNINLASQFSIITVRDTYNFSMSAQSRKSVIFAGNGYGELERYSNEGESIQNVLSSGAVKEDEIFAASLRSTTNEAGDRELSRRETGYREDSRFSGIYSSTTKLTAQNNTEVEVSNTYTGRIDLKRVMGSSINRSILWQNDGLPCCIDAEKLVNSSLDSKAI